MVGTLGDSVFNRTIYRFKNAIRREGEKESLSMGDLQRQRHTYLKERKNTRKLALQLHRI
jgi:hypothetical protein